MQDARLENFRCILQGFYPGDFLPASLAGISNIHSALDFFQLGYSANSVAPALQSVKCCCSAKVIKRTDQQIL